MTTKRYIWIVLILASCCRLFAADPNAWEKLNLSSAHIADATVYYEKSFEPKLPIFEKAYKQFVTKMGEKRLTAAQKGRIIADINQILGITEEDTEWQHKMLTEFLSFFPMAKPTFYLVRRETTKKFLRAGGKLPNFTYDKTTDMAEYRLEFKETSETGPSEDIEVTFPLGSEATFGKEVNQIFEILYKNVFGSGKIGITLHEVVEMSLLKRVRPKDPYWRWFSDGFANAITIDILKKYTGAEVAEEFAKAYDVNEYKELEKEINLRYWMSLKYCILHRMPVDCESKLTYARYAYATLEAQRLIEKHGISCVKKILDKLSQKGRSTSENLLATIKEVTGEDMQQRLGRYQAFQTRKEGMAKYAGLFNAASDKKDYEQMLINLLRILELQDSQFSPTSLRCYKEAALLLFKLGYEEAGDRAMNNCLELFESSRIPLAADAAKETFIIYALDCKNPKKAEKIAEQVLKDRPNHAPSLVVKMFVHAESGRLDEAKQIAKKIHSLAKKEKDKQSLSYKAASRILATDTNQQQLDE